MNPLYGKKYIACGDSLTEGDFSGWTDESGLAKKESPIIYDEEWDMYKTYPYWIGKRNNMTVINEAKCGSILALSKTYLSGEEGVTMNAKQPFSLERYKQIPEDADYCTIWFGCNDSAHTIVGTIDDATNETFYGAWNVVLGWLKENRPNLKVGIIVTYDTGKDWQVATRECAKKWNIPYLDWMNEDGTSKIQLDNKTRTLLKEAWVNETNRHPNVETHLSESYIIEDFLKGL